MSQLTHLYWHTLSMDYSEDGVILVHPLTLQSYPDMDLQVRVDDMYLTSDVAKWVKEYNYKYDKGSFGKLPQTPSSIHFEVKGRLPDPPPFLTWRVSDMVPSGQMTGDELFIDVVYGYLPYNNSCTTLERVWDEVRRYNTNQEEDGEFGMSMTSCGREVYFSNDIREMTIAGRKLPDPP